MNLLLGVFDLELLVTYIYISNAKWCCPIIYYITDILHFISGFAVLTNGVVLLVQTSLMESPIDNESSIYVPWVSYFFVTCKYRGF